MTEAEWFACEDPLRMLRFSGNQLSDRKFRLFNCACCRHLGNLLTDNRQAIAIQVAEMFADGVASLRELRAAQKRADRATGRVAASADYPDPEALRAQLAVSAAVGTLLLKGRQEGTLSQLLRANKRKADYFAGLLRDIRGNPFHPVSLVPAWFAWNDGTVLKLAQTIYNEWAFDRLPILADALEEAGCTDAGILDHCRGSGPHARGCWAVDLLLGKQ